MTAERKPDASSQPSFAERVIELERYMTGLPFGTLDSAIFTDLMKAIREQRAALESLVTLCDETDSGIFSGANSYDEARAVLARWRIE